MPHITIGSSPCEEECAQVGQPDYVERATRECRRFRDLIRAKVGPEPAGARLALKWSPHDFGSYCEVVCHYDPARPASEIYAYRCEAEAPPTWEE